MEYLLAGDEELGQKLEDGDNDTLQALEREVGWLAKSPQQAEAFLAQLEDAPMEAKCMMAMLLIRLKDQGAVGFTDTAPTGVLQIAHCMRVRDFILQCRNVSEFAQWENCVQLQDTLKKTKEQTALLGNKTQQSQKQREELVEKLRGDADAAMDEKKRKEVELEKTESARLALEQLTLLKDLQNLVKSQAAAAAAAQEAVMRQEAEKRRLREEEERQRRQKEEVERQRRQREEEEDKQRRQREEVERQRSQREQEEQQRRQKEQEEQRRQREQEEQQRRQREQEEQQRKRAEEERQRRQREEEEERQRRQREEEEKQRSSCVQIEYGNTARHNGAAAGNSWDWTFFVRVAGGDDARISKVVVELHPTFPNPVREITRAPFELSTSGWGTFEIKFTVHVRNGRAYELRWMLNFSQSSSSASATLQ